MKLRSPQQSLKFLVPNVLTLVSSEHLSNKLNKHFQGTRSIFRHDLKKKMLYYYAPSLVLCLEIVLFKQQ